MKLKRTTQCAKCPWRVDVDPNDIPNGYDREKHKKLESTIAKGLNFSCSIKAMACHETHDSECLGWLMNQLGPGNNISLRLSMRSCENLRDVKLIGEQHKHFRDTIPEE
jgi:hypothetical protein